MQGLIARHKANSQSMVLMADAIKHAEEDALLLLSKHDMRLCSHRLSVCNRATAQTARRAILRRNSGRASEVHTHVSAKVARPFLRVHGEII